MNTSSLKKSIALMAFTCALTSLLPIASHAQASSAALHTPKPGSAERAAIMDAMRPVIGRGYQKKIVFVVHGLYVQNGWAYFSGFAQDAHGKPVGPPEVGGNLSALLRRAKGKWQMKYFVYHGDVVEPDFIKRYPQVPKAIFKGG